MQPHSSPPPPFRPMASRVAGAAQGESRTADRNEFADAVARMFEHRQQVAPDFAPALRDDVPVRDEPDELEAPRVSLLSTLIGASALRRALSIVPLAILGSVSAWFLYFEPSQRVTTKPVVDILQEASRAAAAIELPAPRPEVAEAKSAPPPAPPPVAPAGGAPAPTPPRPRRASRSTPGRPPPPAPPPVPGGAPPVTVAAVPPS